MKRRLFLSCCAILVALPHPSPAQMPSTVDKPTSAAATRTVRPPAGLVAELVAKHGEAQRPRIERGLRQVLQLWRRPTE